MKAVIQRVRSAFVSVDGTVVGSCEKGLLVLLGVAPEDTEADMERMIQKMVKMRIFEDENGKMNLSLGDVAGEMLVVSQFTLFANYKHGNRPDYLGAAAPDMAKAMYEKFVARAAELVPHVGHGVFGADMQVSLVNDGPVTIVMESDVLAPAEKKQ